MGPIVTYVLGYASGFVTGWVVRSISDSPQGVAVKLLEKAHDAKERVVRWTSLQRERLEDMLAEARAGAGQDAPHGEPSHNDKDKEKDKGKDNHQQKEGAGHEPKASEA
jgi:hypothetical protein